MKTLEENLDELLELIEDYILKQRKTYFLGSFRYRLKLLEDKYKDLEKNKMEVERKFDLATVYLYSTIK